MFVSRFFWPTVKLLPLDLSGDLTDYEFLTRVCNSLKEIIRVMEAWGPNFERITELEQDVANIESELEKIKNGDYVSLYLDSIISYINENLLGFVGNIAKFVVFGLSQDGHFVALVPSTWQFIHFDTIMDYSSELYGHLVLRW